MSSLCDPNVSQGATFRLDDLGLQLVEDRKKKKKDLALRYMVLALRSLKETAQMMN